MLPGAPALARGDDWVAVVIWLVILGGAALVNWVKQKITEAQQRGGGLAGPSAGGRAPPMSAFEAWVAAQQKARQGRPAREAAYAEAQESEDEDDQEFHEEFEREDTAVHGGAWPAVPPAAYAPVVTAVVPPAPAERSFESPGVVAHSEDRFCAGVTAAHEEEARVRAPGPPDRVAGEVFPAALAARLTPVQRMVVGAEIFRRRAPLVPRPRGTRVGKGPARG